MPGRDKGRRSALIITQRGGLASELKRCVEDVGLDPAVLSNLESLETQADLRPAVVITDLALKPTERQWSSLVQLFPRSALWAITSPERDNLNEVVTAIRHGCHDCLSQPVSDEVLRQKLASLQPTAEAHTGALDRFMANDIRLELPSDLSLIEHVVRMLASRCRDYRSYGPRTLVNLRVALSEALSNAIVYGNGRDRNKIVRVRASVDAWRITVQVTDEGAGFDPKSVPDPTHVGAIGSAGGRGIFLLKQLADEVSFSERGNSVTITLRSDWHDPARGKVEEPIFDDADLLVGVFERIRAGMDADIHLWAEDIEGKLRHVAPRGVDAGEPEAQLRWLRAPGLGYAVETRPAEDPCAERWADLTCDLLERVVDYELKLSEARRDRAERQEEIELLHSITETLGAVTQLEDATSQILEGVVRVTGADRASLWIYDASTDELVLAASQGPARIPVERVPVSSALSVSALAFREDRTIRLEDARDLPAELSSRLSPRPDPWVAVPVSYTSPKGRRRTVGVLNLIGRSSGASVAGVGETRLLQTLARQIGSAVENLRLIEEIRAQERLIGELELAHDLQMKLLPDLREFHQTVDVAARCVPARPVGGDFYQLFKLSDGKIGAMLGDVTSHGFSAALIMALSMSVTGIYARETTSPGDLLRAIHNALIQRLESAEMFMTVFYGVIDSTRGELCYANAGHAHAFRFHQGAPPARLFATSPPLGIAEYGSYDETSVPWDRDDVLCLFTDGLTNPSLKTTENAVLQAAHRRRGCSAEEIVSALFEARGRQGGAAPDDQTGLVLRLRGDD